MYEIFKGCAWTFGDNINSESILNSGLELWANPLIDTSGLRKAYTYVIRKKGASLVVQ